MSDLSHRTLPELKSFVRKFREHFKIPVSSIKKTELLKKIEIGMMKAMSPDLQKGLKNEYNRLKEPKGKKPVEKKPVEKKSVEKKSVVPKGSHRMPDGSIMKDSDMKKPKLPKRDVKKAVAKIEEEKKPKKKTTIKVSSKSLKAPKKSIISKPTPKN